MIRALMLSMVAAVGCGEFADRELAACHPNCSDAGRRTSDAGRVDGGGTDGSALDAGERDASVADAGVDSDAGTPVLLALDDAWRTTNAIRFGWDSARVGANVEQYLLRYDVDEAEVWGGGGTAWDADDDANLGFFESPHLADPVSRTTVRDLSANTTYFAQLYVRRTSGETVAVARGTASTLPTRDFELDVFREELPMGTVRVQFGLPTNAPRARGGTRALWVERGEGERNASIRELGLEVPAGFGPRFEAAFIEFYADLDFGGALAPLPNVRVVLFGAPPMSEYSYSYVSLPARQGFQRVQIPLRAFRRNDTRFDATALGERLEGFQLSWIRPPTSGLIVDDIVVRY